MEYSHSRLTTFERCMRMGYFKYIQKRPEPSGMPAMVGKIFHVAFSKVITEGYRPEDAVAFSIYMHGGMPEGEKADEITRMVHYTHHRLDAELQEFSDVSSEIHLKAEIAPGVVLQGILDLIIEDPANDEVVIADLKTTWSPFEASETRQLPLYGLLFKEMRGGFLPGSFRGKIMFSRFSGMDTEVELTNELIEATRGWALSLIEKIESAGVDIENFPMTEKRTNCEHCAFNGLCAAGFVEGLPGDGVPKDEEEAVRIGQYLVYQELFLKRMKDGLKQYVKKNKPVEMPMGAWTFKQSEPSPKIAVDVLLQFAQEHNLEMAEVLKADNAKLREWMDNDPTGFLQSQVTYTKPKATFSFIEKKEEECYVHDC